MKFSSTKTWLFIFFICVILSCRKDNGESNLENQTEALDVGAAKAYYKQLKAANGNQVFLANGNKTSTSTLPNKKTLIFSKAYSSQNARNSFVEVPLVYNRRVGSFIKSKSANYTKEEEKEIINGSVDRLLIYKSKKTGKISERIITYIPSLRYLRSKKNDISSNKIDKIDRTFEGFIKYSFWDGTPDVTFIVKNGKNQGKLNYAKTKNRKQAGRVSACEEYVDVLIIENCYTFDPEGLVEICEYEYIEIDRYEICDDEPTGDDCIDYGICDDEPPAPEPEPCTSYTSYDKNGARIMEECNEYAYILDPEIRANYPQFASLVDNMHLFLSMNPKVMDALIQYTGFSKDQIDNIVKSGSGPSIKLIDNNITDLANGYFNSNISDNTLFLSKENVGFFENNPSITDRQRIQNALGFSLLVTILHETVHYGRFQNGLADPSASPDYGTQFEQLGFGFNVEFTTDQKVNYKIYYLPN